MSVFAIVAIVVGAVLLVLLVGGFVVARRRTESPEYAAHVASADRALEAARAADRGWDRALLDAAARAALEERRPDLAYRELHLVLVDDRPGVKDDRAHLLAVGEGSSARVVLTRSEHGEWVCEGVE